MNTLAFAHPPSDFSSLDGVPWRFRSVRARNRLTAGWTTLLGFAASSTTSRRPGRVPRSEACFKAWQRPPLLGFTPLRRLRTGSPDNADAPTSTFAPPMPIHTASATCSSVVPSGFHPGNDLGVSRPSGGFPPTGRPVSPLRIPSWRSPALSVRAASSSTFPRASRLQGVDPRGHP